MKKIYVLVLAAICVALMTCKKDVEPYTIEPEIKVDEITDNKALVEATSEEAGFDKLDVTVEYSVKEDFSDKKQIEMQWKNDCFKAEISGLLSETKYYYKVVFAGKYNSMETETKSFTTLAGDNYNGHEYVDLGLSVKWATCNVGASSPEEYGNYYAWGETTTKTEYTVDNCPTYGLGISELQSQGYIDGDGNLTLSHDAARANWGGSWRMPTYDEINELITNCTWTWTTQNGVKGYKVASKTNSNYIFLPAAGYRFGSSLDHAGSDGICWSSTPFESSTYFAYYLYFNSGNHYMSYNNRYYGLSVRPVTE